MARRPFSRGKKNETKNQEAIDVFKMFNRLAPSTRDRYLKIVDEFKDFLLIHKKSLWDADFEDMKKFLLENTNKSARSIVSTFYRVLIDAGEFERENPVVQLTKIEREQEGKEQEELQPLGRAENVLKELEEDAPTKTTSVASTSHKMIGKKIMLFSDLESLIRRTSHIRDRAILEFLYATGSQILEIVNLNVADIDLESRKVSIHDKREDVYRVLILPRRTINFLKIYERWRRRQLSPSQAYFITKTTRKRMSETSISTWLNRIQKDKTKKDRWTAMDFRKRALLQHYWVTRDLTAVTRFGGYKRPESALNLISDVLASQGVDSIDKLSSLPEFEELQKDRKQAGTIGSEDQLTITIQLDKEEMDIIRNSGLTPTQAVKTIISLKDLYGAFGGGGGGPAIGGSKPTTTSGGPSSTPTSGPSPGGPSLGGGPKPAGPSLGAPSLSATPPSGGPNLSSAPKPAGPSLSGPASPGGPGGSAGGLGGIADALKGLSKAPPKDDKPPARPPPGGGGGEPPQSQMGELKALLARRRKMADAQPEDEKKEDALNPGSIGGKVLESDDEKKDKGDDKDKEIDLPDFSI